MTPEDKQRIKDAFNSFVAIMPPAQADSPFYTKGDKQYTPRQLAAEIESETGEGKAWLDAQEACVDKGFTTVNLIVRKLAGP